MNPVLKAFLMKFLKVFLIAAGGMVLQMLIVLTTQYHPEGETQKMIWQYAMLPGLIALIAAIKRWIQFDASKVGK